MSSTRTFRVLDAYLHGIIEGYKVLSLELIEREDSFSKQPRVSKKSFSNMKYKEHGNQ